MKGTSVKAGVFSEKAAAALQQLPPIPVFAAEYVEKVGSKEKVDELTTRLKEDGYEVVSGPRTTGDGYYESCVVGIEGNQIELTV